VITNQNFTK